MAPLRFSDIEMFRRGVVMLGIGVHARARRISSRDSDGLRRADGFSSRADRFNRPRSLLTPDPIL